MKIKNTIAILVFVVSVSSVSAQPKFGKKIDLGKPINVALKKDKPETKETKKEESQGISLLGSNESKDDPGFAGWTDSEVNFFTRSNGYFAGGWYLSDCQLSKKYSDELPVPCIALTYKGACFPGGFKMHCFRMADKSAVMNFDFKKMHTGEPGQFDSELVIVNYDKHIMYFSRMEGQNDETDKSLSTLFSEMQRRLPNELRMR